MLKLIYVFIFVLITSVFFVLFYAGARKIGREALKWGFVGGIAFVVPSVVLSPIAWNLFRSSLDPSIALLFSYFFIVFAAASAVAVIVYRKFLLKAKLN